MFTIQFIDLAANLSVAAAGLVLAWALLRLMDKSLGISFGADIWPQLKEGNLAPAIYFGARVVAVLGFVGACLSRVPL